MAQSVPTSCTGKACQHVISGDEATCESGSSTCSKAWLLEAELSKFHDVALVEATKRINQILEAIPPDPGKRTLSFLFTEWGQLLAWVDHNAVAPEDGVRPDADEATIAKALRLKGNYAASGAGAS